jgi:hypothetical protein
MDILIKKAAWQATPKWVKKRDYDNTFDFTSKVILAVIGITFAALVLLKVTV